MGYGLGCHGWVTLTYRTKDRPPLDVLTDYLLGSSRAVAPKTLARQLGPPPA